MNNYVWCIIFSSILSCNNVMHPQARATVSAYSKAAAHHFASTDGIKDLAAAYSVAMFMTLLHEMGHAAVAKLTCGVPVDIVIGGARRKDSRLTCAGIEFAGFNPLESNSRWEERYKGDELLYRPSLRQDTAMLVAGPLVQALTCCCLCALLKNKNKFYLTKAAAVGGLVDTLIGANGLYGALFLPWSDAAKIVKNIKQHVQPKPAQQG